MYPRSLGWGQMLTEIVAFCHLLLPILTTGFLLVPSGFQTRTWWGAPAFLVVLCYLNVGLASTSFTKAAGAKASTSPSCLLPFTKGPWESGRSAKRGECHRRALQHITNWRLFQIRKQISLSKSITGSSLRWFLSVEPVLQPYCWGPTVFSHFLLPLSQVPPPIQLLSFPWKI